MTDRFTACIIGSGVAGRFLAHALSRAGRTIPVMLVTRPVRQAPDRIWWVPHNTAKRQALALGGKSLTGISLGHAARTLKANALTLTRSSAALPDTREIMAEPSGLQIIETEADCAFLPLTKGIQIDLGGQSFSTRYVFDTRPEGGGRIRGDEWSIVAWSVRYTTQNPGTPSFSLSPARIVDGAVQFIQRSRLDADLEHVEYVRICPPGDDGTDLQAALIQEMQTQSAIDLRVTRNVWPIAPPQSDKRRGAIYTIRAGAGGLRFTSGTEAFRLAEWAEDTAQRLALGQRPAPVRRTPISAWVGYEMLRHALKSGPQATADLINAMMTKLSGDDALMALSGHPNWRSLFRLAIARR